MAKGLSILAGARKHGLKMGDCGLWFFELVLPYPKNIPSAAAKQARHLPISLFISQDFGLPIIFT